MTEETKFGVSRRTLAKGAAWSVPAAAVIAVAPSVAASPQTPTVTATDTACKLPGASCQSTVGVTKGYGVGVVICASEDTVFTFGPASVSMDGAPATTWTVGPNPLTITKDGCATVTLGIQGEPNSKNVQLNGSFTYTWTTSDGDTGTGKVEFHAPSTPPCNNCSVVGATEATTQKVEPVAEPKPEVAKTTEPEPTRSAEAKPEPVEEKKVEAAPVETKSEETTVAADEAAATEGDDA